MKNLGVLIMSVKKHKKSKEEEDAEQRAMWDEVYRRRQFEMFPDNREFKDARKKKKGALDEESQVIIIP